MGNEQDDNTASFIKLLKAAKENPLILVVLVASFTGISTDRTLDIIFPPRADPYTGAMGIAEETARIQGDASIIRALEAEREKRAEEDNRVLRIIQKIERELDDFEKYRNDHRVEAAQGFARIQQLEKEIQKK